MAPTPVVVVSGSLGSGKTTLVNHLLRTSGARVGVVINDFGQIDVDALLVAGQVGTAAFGGGCLCCLTDSSELDDALARLARLDLDVVLVEASGLAEPRELARMILASEAPGVRFGGVVEVLDASAWAGDDVPVALDHLRVASLLVLNKADRAASPVEDVRARLSGLAPGVPVAVVTDGAVPPPLLLDVADRPEPTGQLSLADLLAPAADHDHAHHHAHDAYDTVALDGDDELHPARLVAVLEDPPAGTVRAKGVVRVAGVDGPVVVQAVGRWYSFARPERGSAAERTAARTTDGSDGPGGGAGAGLVVIGVGLDEDAARARLAALPLAPGETPTPDEVYAVARFLRR